ncbi:MAG: hypothetical protein HZT42_05915 [Paracoccaceae bacterium]|nr:MAG: hypothetical protein HZT42_05915 [Paracoccaceae bacterium]
MKQLADRMKLLKHEVTMYDEMIRLLQVEREMRALELESLSSRYESTTDKEGVYERHQLQSMAQRT